MTLDLFVKALDCWTKTKLESIRRLYSDKGRKYMDKTEDVKQYPFLRKGLYGSSTSQGTEVMNNSNKEFRHMGMYSAYIRFVERDQQRHVQALVDSRKLAANLLPTRVQSRISDLFVHSMNGLMAQVSFTDALKTKARVPSQVNPLLVYLVDFSDKTCSCGKWQETRFPCIHMMRAARASSKSVADYLDTYSTTATYKAQYDGVDYRLPPFEYVIEEGSALSLPVALPARRGKPRKKRAESAFERYAKRRYRCSNCNSLSHNSRRCPHPDGYKGKQLETSGKQKKAVARSSDRPALKTPTGDASDEIVAGSHVCLQNLPAADADEAQPNRSFDDLVFSGDDVPEHDEEDLDLDDMDIDSLFAEVQPGELSDENEASGDEEQGAASDDDE